MQYHVDRAGSKITLLLGKFDEDTHLEWIKEHKSKAPKPVGMYEKSSIEQCRNTQNNNHLIYQKLQMISFNNRSVFYVVLTIITVLNNNNHRQSISGPIEFSIQTYVVYY